MPTVCEIDAFLARGPGVPLVDVRTPAEFAQGHIPGAHNLPLFDNAGRAVVGTTYQQAGRYAAILQGLDLVGPRLRTIVEAVARLGPPSGAAAERTVAVHCWRGGMRSSSVGWLLEQAGYRVLLLAGGYKAYRRHVLAALDKPRRLAVLSGLTGAGKTRQLQQLAARGEQVVDLERLARHRGSAFGGIGLEDQPTVEQFENDLIAALEQCDPGRRIWLEDESQRIGRVVLSNPFFARLKQAPAIFLEVPLEQRVAEIEREYGDLPAGELAAAIHSITKRLGGAQAAQALAALASGARDHCIRILLEYYDRTYANAKAKIRRSVFQHLPVSDPCSAATTAAVLAAAEELGM